MNVFSSTHSVSSATAAAIVEARDVATRNGYTDGANGASVGVDVSLLSSGITVKVGISAPHMNNFSRVMPGQDQWTVSTEATAMTGSIDTAAGAAPWTMSIDAFPGGTVAYGPSNPQDFGESNGDVPTSALDIAWTDYNGYNNVDSNEVRRILDGTHTINATFDWDQYLGQHNSGNHTTLFDDVNANLAGKNVAVPIVGPPTAPNTTCLGTSATTGCFKGWAVFHVISASGGSAKHIRGYFVPDGFQKSPLSVGECTTQEAAANRCGVIELNAFGAYTVRLID
jgi:hypothetical protein